jgi:hypothetical protein
MVEYFDSILPGTTAGFVLKVEDNIFCLALLVPPELLPDACIADV